MLYLVTAQLISTSTIFRYQCGHQLGCCSSCIYFPTSLCGRQTNATFESMRQANLRPEKQVDVIARYSMHGKTCKSEPLSLFSSQVCWHNLSSGLHHMYKWIFRFAIVLYTYGKARTYQIILVETFILHVMQNILNFCPTSKRALYTSACSNMSNGMQYSHAGSLSYHMLSSRTQYGKTTSSRQYLQCPLQNTHLNNFPNRLEFIRTCYNYYPNPPEFF